MQKVIVIAMLSFIFYFHLFGENSKKPSLFSGLYFYKSKDQKSGNFQIEEMIHFAFVKKQGFYNIYFYRAGELFRFVSVKIDCNQDKSECNVIGLKDKKLYMTFKVADSSNISLAFITKATDGGQIFIPNSNFTQNFSPDGIYNYE